MKVIFLDFNGVLDTWDDMDVIDESNLNRLKRIVEETSSKVVISSSIKRNYVNTGVMRGNLKYLVDTLLECGIDVIGVTPNLEKREEEILMYLSEHNDIDGFVILDDDYEMPKLKDHLVKLPCQMIGSKQRGLEDEHVLIAINILGKENVNEKKRLI